MPQSTQLAINSAGRYIGVANNKFFKSDSTILRNNYDTFFSSLDEDIVSVAISSNQCFAITQSGKVYAWGSNDSGQLGINPPSNNVPQPALVLFPDGTKVVEVIAGQDHTFFRTDTQVYGCGKNNRSQLGGAAGVKQFSPTLIPFFNNKNINSMASFMNYNVAVTEEGEVYHWGTTDAGTIDKPTIYALPKSQSATAKVIKVITGDNHAVALYDNGRVCTWGNNQFAQLGRDTSSNTTSDDNLPAFIPGLTDVVDIVGGPHHCIALDKSGKAYGWGWNEEKQSGLENNDQQHFITSPTALIFPSDTAIGAIATCVTGTVTISKDLEKIYSVGKLNNLQNDSNPSSNQNESLIAGNVKNALKTMASAILERSKPTEIIPVPAPISPLSIPATEATENQSKIVFHYHGDFIVTDKNGKLFQNDFSNAANETTTQAIAAINGKNKKIIAVAGSESHTLVIDEDGKVYGWSNVNNNDAHNVIQPFNFGQPEQKIVTAAAGDNYSLFLGNDGKLFKCNGAGKNTIQALFNDITFSSIAVKGDRNAAIATNGDIYCWSAGHEEQVTIIKKADLTFNPKKIIVGDACYIALSEDGKAYSWTNNVNYLGEDLGRESTISSLKPAHITDLIYKYTNNSLCPVKDIITGSNHSFFALLEDGTLCVWGNCLSEMGILQDSKKPQEILFKKDSNGNYLVITKITASGGYAIAIDDKNEVYILGSSINYNKLANEGTKEFFYDVNGNQTESFCYKLNENSPLKKQLLDSLLVDQNASPPDFIQQQSQQLPDGAQRTTTNFNGLFNNNNSTNQTTISTTNPSTIPSPTINNKINFIPPLKELCANSNGKFTYDGNETLEVKSNNTVIIRATKTKMTLADTDESYLLAAEAFVKAGMQEVKLGGDSEKQTRFLKALHTVFQTKEDQYSLIKNILTNDATAIPIKLEGNAQRMTVAELKQCINNTSVEPLRVSYKL